MQLEPSRVSVTPPEAGVPEGAAVNEPPPGTLTEGKQALPTSASHRDDVANRLRDAYGAFFVDARAAQLGSPIQASELLVPIEKCAQHREVKLVQPEFRELHIEPLLDQAASLLDRCLADRAQRNALGVEAFRAKLEIDQFLAQEVVLQKEIAAGLYTVPLERAIEDQKAEAAVANSYKNANGEYDRIAQRVNATDAATKQLNARRFMAWLSAMPLKESDLNSGNDASYTLAGVAKNKADHLLDSAATQGEEEILAQYWSMYAHQHTLTGTSEASVHRGASLAKLAAWSLNDIGFRRERADIARTAAYQKIRAMADPGGALNYLEQIHAIEERFAADLAEVSARLQAVERGMAIVFDYREKLPAVGTPHYLDNLVLWVRRAVSFLVRFSRIDQNYVLPISLRVATGEGWKPGRRLGRWRFTVGPDAFRDQYHVRLRGLSASVVGGTKDGYWRVTVAPPPVGLMKRLSGDIRINQSSLPICRLGRVGRVFGMYEPEITGINALHNASPIGEWDVAMGGSGSGTDLEDVEDVTLELHLAVRSRG